MQVGRGAMQVDACSSLQTCLGRAKRTSTHPVSATNDNLFPTQQTHMRPHHHNRPSSHACPRGQCPHSASHLHTRPPASMRVMQ